MNSPDLSSYVLWSVLGQFSVWEQMENIRKIHVLACTNFGFLSNRKLSFCLYVRNFSTTSPTGLKIKEGVCIFLWLNWPHMSLDLVKRASLDAVENHSIETHGTIHTCKTHCSLRSLDCWVCPRGEQRAHHGKFDLIGKTSDFAAFTVQQYQLTDQSFVPLPVLVVALYTRH